MNEEREYECPQCLGAQEIFNGRTITECNLCLGEGSVKKDIYEIYYGDDE